MAYFATSITKNSHLKLAVVMAISSVMLLSLIAPVGMANAAPTKTSSASFVNNGDVPTGSKLILNINYKVTNDEDSGNVGYWALDNYNKNLKVWQVPDGSFYAVVRYNGNWNTFAGALSPGLGIAESKDASGTFQGGYVATFTGTFNHGTLKTNGNIGTFDFSGTKADILKGTYGAGQTGPTTVYDWESAYFTGGSSINDLNWGWTYHYKSQDWNNFATGTTGDIVS